jgi:hypothetical protein
LLWNVFEQTDLQEQQMTIRTFGLAAMMVFTIGGTGAFAAERPTATGPVVENEPPIRLLLNVPAHRLYVYESGKLTHTFRIAVGEVGHETPSGDYRIRDIIWNPWWHPPNSAWARDRQIEPPSENNPMGRVKMNFSNLLYIHGSPEVGLLGRAASKGCIRMSNEEVMELARLLHSYVHPNLGESTIGTLAGNQKMTRTFDVPRGVPFKVIYQVAEVKDGNLIIYPDIYGKTGNNFAAQVRAVLSGHGVDPTRINREHFDRLVEKAQTAIVSASIAELAGARGLGAEEQEQAAVR